MFPVCCVGARAQGLGSSPRSRTLCHGLARVVKQHFWLSWPPCCVSPKLLSNLRRSRRSRRVGVGCVSGGGAVTRLWDVRGEARRSEAKGRYPRTGSGLDWAIGK